LLVEAEVKMKWPREREERLVVASGFGREGSLFLIKGGTAASSFCGEGG
jgi:hypothetical protein